MNEQEIFVQLLKQTDPADRLRSLDNACRGNAPLRERVEVLLRAHNQAGQFLESPAAGSVATLDHFPATEEPGTVIGRYKLLEQIGEGGMGVVYVAEQSEPVRRRVALKIIKPGMDTKQVIARFEAERQALAMMDHPNIARILDAGTVGEGSRHTPCAVADDDGTRSVPTTMGRPYFVMELVKGMPITDYCEQSRLPVRQRLELFADVCQAVQHAHQKGIIHRDLKPSNVLITLHDGTPAVKVIDFGVAKAIGQQLTERTIYTAHAQLVGTPLYMSPEQAELSGLDVDTRSDVYSLGVLLYELLTGTTPFDKDRLKSVTFDEMRRIIREEEPETVSTRLARTKSSRHTPCAVASGNGTRSVPTTSELDWIAMKALEKDRKRRYESASTLAADVQRYLSDEPVLACPPTAMYRFQKFARKHKPALVTAAAVALCLLLGTTVSAWQAVRATQAEAEATAEKQKAVASEQKAVANAAAAEQKEQEALQQRDEVKALAEKLAAKEEQLQQTLYTDHIHMAQAAWDNGNVGAMSQLLAQHVPAAGERDRRNFEWHYLNRLSNIGPLVSISTPNVRSQYELSLNADRTRLIRYKPASRPNSAQNGGTPMSPPTLQAWNLETGQEEFAVEIPGVPDGTAGPFPLGRTYFTPDGAYLVINSSRWVSSTPRRSTLAEVKVWDTRTGKEVFQQNGLGTNVVVCISPDNKLLALPLSNRSVKVWELQTGQERLTLQGQPERVPTAIAFSPDGKRLAAIWNTWDDSKQADEIRIWNAETGEQLKSFSAQVDAYELIFTPDGQHLITSDTEKEIKLWDAQTGKELMTFPFEIESIDQLKLNADGTRLIALASEENENKESVEYAKLWNVQTGQELLSLKGPDEVQFSPDGKRVALSDWDNSSTKVYDAHSGQIMLSVKEAGGPVAFSPDSKRVATQSGGTRIWNLETGDEINHIKGFYPGQLLAFSEEGKRLIGSSQVATQVWNAEAEQQSARKILLPRVRGSSPVDGPAISSDFTRIAGISGKTVKLFEAQTGQVLRTLTGHGQFVLCVAFSPDGKRVASSDGERIPTSSGGAVKVWDAETGNELFTIGGLPQRILRLKFSPDGKKLAGTPADNTIKVWDSASGRELFGIGSRSDSLKQSASSFHTFAFSPDGTRLAWQGKIWDAETGAELIALKMAASSTGSINTTAFSPDGKRIVGGMAVGSPAPGRTSPPTANGVWDAQTGELLFTTPVVNGGGCQTFSPNGKRLVGGGNIWDAQTGQFLLRLSGGGTGQVAFSPDGHRLAVMQSWGNLVTIYDATPLANP